MAILKHSREPQSVVFLYASPHLSPCSATEAACPGEKKPRERDKTSALQNYSLIRLLVSALDVVIIPFVTWLLVAVGMMPRSQRGAGGAWGEEFYLSWAVWASEPAGPLQSWGKNWEPQSAPASPSPGESSNPCAFRVL